MKTNARIQEIRALISDSETETALKQTRAYLNENGLDEPLVHLDMLESEWNDIQEQNINGVLDIDDYLRLQNICKAKLMQLLLQVDGEPELSENLVPNTEATALPTRNQAANLSFKNGLKNFIGGSLMLPTLGALVDKQWAVAACFGLAAVITFVPTLRFIEKNIRYELLSWHKYVLVIGGLALAGTFYVPKQNTGTPGSSVETGK